MEQNMITIRNLSKEFKGQSVLKNITMEIPKNCVYRAFGGKQAREKSTLVEINHRDWIKPLNVR